MVLVNSLPDEDFQFMKETLYAKDLSESFPKFSVVHQDMKNYALNKKKATLKSEATTPSGPTVLAATTSTSSVPPPREALLPDHQPSNWQGIRQVCPVQLQVERSCQQRCC
jgi:hypothetical protein